MRDQEGKTRLTATVSQWNRLCLNSTTTPETPKQSTEGGFEIDVLFTFLSCSGFVNGSNIEKIEEAEFCRSHVWRRFPGYVA